MDCRFLNLEFMKYFLVFDFKLILNFYFNYFNIVKFKTTKSLRTIFVLLILFGLLFINLRFGFY